MAAIYPKGNGKYRVVYDNPDGNDRNQRQKTFNSKKEAMKFLREVEYKKDQKQLITPKNKTVEEFFEEWIALYAKANWQGSTYSTNVGMVKNHIIPALGDIELNKVKPLDVEKFIDSLRTKKIAGFKAKYNTEEELPCLSATTIRYIFIILKQAFDKAVEWKLIETNPVTGDVPKRKPVENRTVWSFDDWYLALEDIEHELLHLAVHLAFSCSLRPGEVVGLTWDCVFFDEKKVLIEKTMQRFSVEAMEKLPGDEILKVFPPKTEDSLSRLVLKIPKTVQSKRYIFITDQLVQELSERKKQVARQKKYLGDDYNDYDLVFCLENGDPVETHLVEKWFKKWQKKSILDVPHILFRELRHSSTTFKLKKSDGDYKSVIGDTGHATADLAIRVYGQFVDKNRQELAGKLEDKMHEKELGKRSASKLEQEDREIDIDKLQAILSAIKDSDPSLHSKVLQAVLANQK